VSPSSPAGGPPLRAVAMVLIALAIVFGGLGAFSMSGSSSASSGSGTSTAAASSRAPAGSAVAAPSSAAAVVTPPSPPTTTTAPSGAVDKSLPVTVLNNSTIHGLAVTFEKKLQANGWTDISTGNYPKAVLATTTVFYGATAGEQAAAEAIATELGATAAPKSQGVGIPTSGVVVIVTSE